MSASISVYQIPPCPTCHQKPTHTIITRRHQDAVSRQHKCPCGRIYISTISTDTDHLERHPYTPNCCPYCAHAAIPITHTRQQASTTERYHQCNGCGAHFRTTEPKPTKKK